MPYEGAESSESQVYGLDEGSDGEPQTHGTPVPDTNETDDDRPFMRYLYAVCRALQQHASREGVGTVNFWRCADDNGRRWMEVRFDDPDEGEMDTYRLFATKRLFVKQEAYNMVRIKNVDKGWSGIVQSSPQILLSIVSF